VLEKLLVYLIKPSHYDEEGYVVRHWRGVLPSNTLACLAALTQEVMDRKQLREVKIELQVLDETVEPIRIQRICRTQRLPRVKTLICLAGVQTNQFPRASDLALEFRRAGLAVMLGGFHVSGYLALLPEMPADIQRLLDAGVTIVKGEVEDAWAALLGDAAADRLRPIYDFLGAKPTLRDRPLPMIRRKYLRKFVASNFGTLDCGRGCPFECSFCTIINVQGRKMRYRSAEVVERTVRNNYWRHKVSFYFFTDDNFARNPNWEAIFDMLIRLREAENIPVKFMMQVDVLSWKIRGFLDKAQRAGCQTAFIGMESLNQENLAAAGKRQNRAEEYRDLMEAYRRRGISTHVGYIIGFPADTAESVRQNLTNLMEQVRPDHASFFMLTPLPGSVDHLRMVQRGEWLHPDFNLYDSHHETTRHPRMSGGEWLASYREAWRRFYSLENLRAVLGRSSPQAYWNNLYRFLWYKNSMQTEGRHPMMCGWLRRKGRTERRPGYPVLSRWEFCKMRARELRRDCAGMFRVLLEMEELWLQTRRRSEAELSIAEELHKICAAAKGRLRLADEQLAHLRAKASFPAVRVPSKLHLLWARWYPLLAPARVYTRADLESFWRGTLDKWRERQWFRIPPHRVAFSMFRDAQLSLMFFLQLARPRNGSSQ